jgi:hypothetical protein
VTEPTIVLEQHRHVVLHEATDEWVTLTASAVFTDDGITGPAVHLGDWSLSPNDARLLAQSLTILADLADPTPSCRPTPSTGRRDDGHCD